MAIYAVSMFLYSVIFGIVAAQIYKGNTGLINSYHQTKVTDKTGYAKAFGKAMTVFAVAMALSGAVAFFDLWIAVVLLFAGLIAGTVAVGRVQKKYNGGLF